MLALALAWSGGGASGDEPADAPPSLEDGARFVQERSTVTYTVGGSETLSDILRRHRLPLSRASVLRLNPDLDEADLAGSLEPGLRLTLFVQGDFQER